MARLRQEMKEEDLELAALDERNNAPQEDSAPKPQEEIIQVNQEELEGLDQRESDVVAHLDTNFHCLLKSQSFKSLSV